MTDKYSQKQYEHIPLELYCDKFTVISSQDLGFNNFKLLLVKEN